MNEYESLENIDLTIKEYLENGYKNSDIIKVISAKYFKNNNTQAEQYMEKYLDAIEKEYREETLDYDYEGNNQHNYSDFLDY